jgi:hypothetical protein
MTVASRVSFFEPNRGKGSVEYFRQESSLDDCLSGFTAMLNFSRGMDNDFLR